MASYIEIRRLTSNGDLINKMETATVVAAYNLITVGTPTVADKQFANDVFASPNTTAKQVLMGVLAANKALTVSQILGATDAQYQTQVDVVFTALKEAAAGV